VQNTFALTVLIQKRCQELVAGARKLVEGEFKSPIDVAVQEIIEEKIWLSGDATA
jgi:DNA-directed RNA polymerase subunit K/omega